MTDASSGEKAILKHGAVRRFGLLGPVPPPGAMTAVVLVGPGTRICVHPGEALPRLAIAAGEYKEYYVVDLAAKTGSRTRSFHSRSPASDFEAHIEVTAEVFDAERYVAEYGKCDSVIDVVIEQLEKSIRNKLGEYSPGELHAAQRALDEVGQEIEDGNGALAHSVVARRVRVRLSLSKLDRDIITARKVLELIDHYGEDLLVILEKQKGSALSENYSDLADALRRRRQNEVADDHERQKLAVDVMKELRSVGYSIDDLEPLADKLRALPKRLRPSPPELRSEVRSLSDQRDE